MNFASIIVYDPKTRTEKEWNRMKIKKGRINKDGSRYVWRIGARKLSWKEGGVGDF